MSLVCPTLGGSRVVRLLDQAAIQEFAIDELAADMNARRQELGGPFGRVTAGKGFCEGGFGDQEPGSEAVAQKFDAFRPVGQGRDVTVFERVDPARMKEQMRGLLVLLASTVFLERARLSDSNALASPRHDRKRPLLAQCDNALTFEESRSNHRRFEP